MAFDIKEFKSLPAERQEEARKEKDHELEELKSSLKSRNATIEAAFAGSTPPGDIAALIRERDGIQNKIKECEDDLVKMGKKSEDKAPALASFETLFPDDLKKENTETETGPEASKKDIIRIQPEDRKREKVKTEPEARKKEDFETEQEDLEKENVESEKEDEKSKKKKSQGSRPDSDSTKNEAS